MAETLFSFDVCVCVCLCPAAFNAATDFKFDLHVPRDSPDVDPYKFFEKEAWPVHVNPTFWALNAYSSRRVKDFKFGVHVPIDVRT